MTPHPYRLAAVLAGTTVVGLSALLVTPGFWGTPWLVLAAVPMGLGVRAYLRASRSPPRSSAPPA